ncbi:MAG: AI-2E family transporter [Deltaproteobacteria bacterium]|nr:AI-2E family transporter [Deltaproteobacteria bacterium]
MVVARPAVRRDVAVWFAILASFAALLWIFGDILLPFLLGMAIAYVVDPVVVWFARRGLSRGMAAGLLVGVSLAVGLATLLVFGPVLIEQARALLARAPEILTAISQSTTAVAERFLRVVGVGPRGEVPSILVQAEHRVEEMLAMWAATLLGRGIALVNLLGLLAVTPLVAFYLLRDWPRILAHIDGWLPRDYADTIRAQAREMDRVLAGFARGAALVSAGLAVFYGAALSLAGLDFGLLIGIVAGALSFVPYLGATVGFGVSVGMALVQFWPDWTRVVLVGAIFVVGNLVSDYIVTPRVVGDRIGVHPLWVLFAFFAGAALFGFAGILASVPACAAIGVVARFAIQQYKSSAFYRGAA